MKGLICIFRDHKWKRVEGTTKWHTWVENWVEDCLRCGDTRFNSRSYILDKSYGTNLCPPNSPHYKKELEKK